MALVNTVAQHGGQVPQAPLIALALSIALDNSYPEGGYAFDPAALLQSLGNYDKAPTVSMVLVEGKGGVIGEFDRANNKLKFLGQTVENMALGPAGLAIGTASAAKIKIVNTVAFLVDAVFKSKATAEVAFTAITHDITNDAAVVKEAVYLVTLDSAGTPTLTKGVTATGAGNALVPNPPSGGTVIGYLRLAVAAGATPFDASTDLLSAAHLTDTYVDLAFVPGQASSEIPTGTDLSTTPGTMRAVIVSK